MVMFPIALTLPFKKVMGMIAQNFTVHIDYPATSTALLARTYKHKRNSRCGLQSQIQLHVPLPTVVPQLPGHE